MEGSCSGIVSVLSDLCRSRAVCDAHLMSVLPNSTHLVEIDKFTCRYARNPSLEFCTFRSHLPGPHGLRQAARVASAVAA